eukprot:CAMPEP_0175244668 /NCGR_PEP_ID=MMETSP0093-20121207/32200_1 /TAXON_ID=311494 /ORGANISM="Alexandrium monilatum, Strain CCMP3105" /LENGTH=128 /DNA_ID=CAMNT_0016538777 /DNA_START=190 /DNA_END=573 /DNA_ORIENTATION=-
MSLREGLLHGVGRDETVDVDPAGLSLPLDAADRLRLTGRGVLGTLGVCRVQEKDVAHARQVQAGEAAPLQGQQEYGGGTGTVTPRLWEGPRQPPAPGRPAAPGDPTSRRPRSKCVARAAHWKNTTHLA